MHKYARRDELWNLTSESTSDVEKKNDATYTSAKFARLPWRTARTKRIGRTEVEREGKGDHCQNEIVSGKKLQCEGEVEELEEFLGPEDVDVDFRRILKEA